MLERRCSSLRHRTSCGGSICTAFAAPNIREARSGSREPRLAAAIGVAIGTALGLDIGSLMSGILFRVAPDATLTIAAVMAAIGLTVMVASLAPLRHAVLVNPAEILRTE